MMLAAPAPPTPPTTFSHTALHTQPIPALLCAVMTAEGRTFPVETMFLEDVYHATGYRLAPDAPAAIRSGGARANANAMRKQAGGGDRYVGVSDDR